MKKQLCTLLLTTLLCLPLSMQELLAQEEGIDVSEWQGSISFQEVKEAGISSVYIKASEGFDYRDPYYRINYEQAKANNFNVGFYHYITAKTTQEAYEQADFFVSIISGLEVEMKFALDFEEFDGLSKDEISAIALTFMDRVKQLTDEDCVLYASAYYANTSFNEDVSEYPLWVAEWGVSSPRLDGAWDAYAGWQYSDRGLVRGINTYVDRDLFETDIYLDESIRIPNHTYTPNRSNDYIEVRVQAGDTLWGIAQAYHTTVASIVSLNNISNPNLIYPGEILRIYPIRKRTTRSLNRNVYYTVRVNDTLSQIAQRFNTTVANLVALNNISNPNLIYPGQVLLIFRGQTTSYFTYTIVYGDTLSQIALRYHTNVETLARINHISNPNLIYAGERIRIPY